MSTFARSAVAWGGADNFDRHVKSGQRARSSRCSSVQSVHFGSIKRQNYLIMASTKKKCWKLMFSEG